MKKRTQLVVMMGLSTSMLAGAALAQGSPGMGGSSGMPGSGGGAGMSGMSSSGGPSGMPGGGMSMSPGGSAAGGDAGSISNVETTETNTSTSFDDTGALPNTGGEPWMMLLAGSLTAGGAFFLRRKLA